MSQVSHLVGCVNEISAVFILEGFQGGSVLKPRQQREFGQLRAGLV